MTVLVRFSKKRCSLRRLKIAINWKKKNSTVFVVLLLSLYIFNNWSLQVLPICQPYCPVNPGFLKHPSLGGPLVTVTVNFRMRVIVGNHTLFSLGGYGKYNFSPLLLLSGKGRHCLLASYWACNSFFIFAIR